MNTSKANLVWRSKGEKTKDLVLELLEKDPNMSLYKLGKALNLSAATIAHHVDKLLEKEILVESISLVRNKSMKTYEIVSNESQVYRLYFEDNDILNWESGKELIVYLINIDMLSVTPKSNINLTRQSLMSIYTILKQNDQGYYIVLPNNIAEFYGISDPNYHCEIEQTVVEDEIKELIISVRRKRLFKMKKS